MSATITNAGPMASFVPPFDVRSKLTDQAYSCIFSHMWNGIATRHSDTIDCKFFVNGRGVVVGMAHTAFVDFQSRTARGLTDREASFIAAEYLAERLVEEEEHNLYHVPHDEVLRLVQKLRIK